MDRRFTNQPLKSWCTGKDSNLRTSLGGTDLQSVGFNHSPTCANFPGRCGRRAFVQQKTPQAAGSRSRKPADQVPTQLSQPRETKDSRQAAAKLTSRSLHT